MESHLSYTLSPPDTIDCLFFSNICLFLDKMSCWAEGGCYNYLVTPATCIPQVTFLLRCSINDAAFDVLFAASPYLFAFVRLPFFFFF